MYDAWDGLKLAYWAARNRLPLRYNFEQVIGFNIPDLNGVDDANLPDCFGQCFNTFFWVVCMLMMGELWIGLIGTLTARRFVANG